MDGYPRRSEAAPGSGGELHRLAEERRECERRLARLTADIATITEDEQSARETAERVAAEKARFLARIRPELLTPLHTVLGYSQLLRMEGSLDTTQAMRLGAVMAAGTHLLERVHALLEIHAGGLDPEQWPGDDAQDRAACATLRAASPSASPAGGAPRPGGPAARSLHVLVVDDAEINRDIAASFLRAAGHSVTVADGGARGVAAAAAAAFDVILMDVRMPVMDGLEAARRVRALGGPRGRVPIVALSAVAMAEQIDACRDAGMNAHLSKPFTPETLVEASERGAALLNPQERTSSGAGLAVGTGDRAWGNFGLPDAPGAVVDLPWIDVACEWEARPPRRSPVARPHAGTGADEIFVVRVRSVGSGARRQADSQSACLPSPEQTQVEFHWLVYVDAAEQAPTVHAACDLWRWNRSVWMSITVPGARFSPIEMHDQGWRYCGPCADRTAKVEILSNGQT